MTFQHNAVHRDILTRTHHEHITFAHLLDGQSHLFPFPDHIGSFGRQLHQALQRIGGPSFGPGFQHLTHGNEGQNHGSRFKIEFMEIVLGHLHIAQRLSVAHGKKRIRAIDKRRRTAQCHQRIHIGCPVPQAFKTTDKKLLVDYHNDCRQQ